MKENLTSIPLIASEDMPVSEMGMAVESRDKLLAHFRDGIYTRKNLAVVREYITNAIDEHVKHGIKRPVETGLRHNAENQVEFYVRDYAEGLSESGMRDVFGMYGRSTKTNTNKQSGMFGLGSKSFFAISESFFVVSYHKGVKTLYCCSLGAGSQGVSVGNMFAVHSEPTEETGLEVYGPVKNPSEFSNELKNFVQYHPADLKVQLYDSEYQKVDPIYTRKIDGIVFRVYKNDNVNKPLVAGVRMGGIEYNQDFILSTRLKNNHVLKIDIPVGSMTIPISRESFEDTEANKRYINTINEVSKKLFEEDMAQFRTKGVMDAVNDSLAGLKRFEGNVFVANYSELFPEIGQAIAGMNKCNSDATLQEKDGKPLLVLIPNNGAMDYWIDKVADFAKQQNFSYYSVAESLVNDKAQEKLKEFFYIRKAKQLPYPKQKSDKKFTVYRGDKPIGKFNAQEFAYFFLESQNVDIGNIDTDDQIRAAVKEIYDACDSTNDLYSLAIHVAQSGRYGERNFAIPSQALRQAVENLGFLIIHHQKYQELHTKIRTIELQQKESEQKIYQFNKIPVEFSQRTKNICENDSKKAEKIFNVYKAMRDKNRLVNKILKLAENHGYYSKFDRKELRQIIKINA